MQAIRYRGTSKRLGTQFRSEAEKTCAEIEKKKQEEITSYNTQRKEQEQAATKTLITKWANLRIGDIVPLYNAKLSIAKKNKYSIITTTGSKYTVEEIIGSKAATEYRNNL